MDQNVTQNGAGVTPDNTQNDNNMASLLEKEGLGIDFPTQGEIRTGVIASITLIVLWFSSSVKAFNAKLVT